MPSKNKKIFAYIFVILSCLLFPIKVSESFSLSTKQIFDYKIKEVKKYQEEKKKKQKIATAITSVYKHVSLTEATRIVDAVYKYSKIHKIDPLLLIGVIAAESSFKKNAVSKKGAVGYTQVNVKYHQDKIKGRNIFDTYVNIQVGTMILSNCLRKHSDLQRGLGCYNGTSDSLKIKKFHKTINARKNQILLLASL